MSVHDEPTLSIGDVARQTGLTEATLRMWEARYGFPRPHRLPSGHRRYPEREVELIGRVLEERGRGLSLGAAIERATEAGEQPERSVFAGLRRRRPDLGLHVLPKRAMVALSHAIEDELFVRAERAVLFGSFQRERHYREAARRWRELARNADYAVALADFAKVRRPREAPIEIPLGRSDPMLSEWALVCTGSDFGACLAGIERPGQLRHRDAERHFEVLWSVEPSVVHDAAHICCELMSGRAARLSREIAGHLDTAQALGGDRYDIAAAVTSRMIAYLGRGPAPGSHAG